MSTVFRDGVNSLRNLGADDLLEVLGLQKRRTAIDVVLPSVALFAAGAVVGAAAAVLLAPKTGAQVRAQLSEGARDLSQRIGTTAQAVQDYVGVNRNHATTSNASAT
ncbi:MAG: YtxH domain-containing protein [Polyangiales bacterium]